MISYRTVRSVASVATLILAASAARPARAQSTAHDASPLPGASSVVKPQAYVSVDVVPRGRDFEVAIVAQILSGYHLNSHTPSQSYLIPTNVQLADSTGFKEVSSDYPQGELYKFDFSPEKLSVYTGSVTIRMKFTPQPDAPLGEIVLPLIFRYQACNATSCLPPAKIPLPVNVKVVAAGAKPRAIHPEIFGNPAKKG